MSRSSNNILTRKAFLWMRPTLSKGVILEAQDEDEDFPRYTPTYMFQANGQRVTDIHDL